MRIINRRARHKYHILETLEVGIVLTGPEVKSLRANRVDLQDSFARVEKGEIFLKNAYIYPYQGIDRQGYDPRRDRKLLLHQKEINYLSGKTAGSNLTLVPLTIYEKRNLFKVELGLSQAKKKYDHKEAAKERAEKRKIEQELRGKI